MSRSQVFGDSTWQADYSMKENGNVTALYFIHVATSYACYAANNANNAVQYCNGLHVPFDVQGIGKGT